MKHSFSKFHPERAIEDTGNTKFYCARPRNTKVRNCLQRKFCNPVSSRPLIFHVRRASDWNLQEPQWVGRMRLVAKGKDCILKLEDKMSGELFAQCPIDVYPGPAVEAVADSSRYFVLRIQDDNGMCLPLRLIVPGTVPYF